ADRPRTRNESARKATREPTSPMQGLGAGLAALRTLQRTTRSTCRGAATVQPRFREQQYPQLDDSHPRDLERARIYCVLLCCCTESSRCDGSISTRLSAETQ